MQCPKCGAFIGVYSCMTCSGLNIKTTDNTREA